MLRKVRISEMKAFGLTEKDLAGANKVESPNGGGGENGESGGGE